MRGICTICHDTVVENDFSAAPCGHTFHTTCLNQWLDHRLTCPQCRVKCTKKQVLKLFIDSSNNDTSLLTSEDINEVSKEELKDRLKEEHELLKEKDDALKKTLKELAQVREELSAWRSQHDSISFKLEQEKGISESLKQQMKVLQKDNDRLDRKAEEAIELRRNLTKFEKIQHLLRGGTSDEQLQGMIDRASHQTLKDYTKVLKNDYESIKKKTVALQEDKKHHAQEISRYKIKVNDSETELCKLRETLSLMESDLQAVESERDSLIKKVQLLEKAIDSPNSRLALRRLLESPLPDCLNVKRPKLELNSSLNGSFISTKDSEAKPLVSPKKLKSVTEDIAAPLLMPNPLSNKSSSVLNVGYNGFGGHMNFIKPKPAKPMLSSKPAGNHNNKPLKFAPRLPVKSSGKKIVVGPKQSSLKFK